MNKFIKHILSMLLTVVMLVSTALPVALASDTGSETTLSYVGIGNIDPVNPDSNNSGSEFQWYIYPSGKNASVYQYELPELAEGEMVVSAKWEAFISSPSTIPAYGIKFVEFDTDTVFSPATVTYNDVLSAGYNDSATPIWSGSSQDVCTMATPNGLTSQFPKFSVEMAEAVQTAIDDGNKYFSFVASGTAGNTIIQMAKAWTPSPQLVITTQTIIRPTVEIIDSESGEKRVKKNTAFDVSAIVSEGSNSLDENNGVTIAVTDSQGANVDVSSIIPVITDNSYTFTFADGLDSGIYTIRITARDDAGITASDTVVIDVLGETNTKLDFVSTADGSSDTQANALPYNWMINIANDTAFQYDLSEIPEGNVVSKAIWNFRSTTMFDTHLAFYKILSQEKFGLWTKNKLEIPAFDAKPFYTTPDMLKDGYKNETWDGITADYFNVDLTDAVNEALKNGERYFGFVVKAVQNRSPIVIGRANEYMPYPSLRVTSSSYRLPVISGEVNNVAVNTPFYTDITVTKGDSDIESVKIYLNDNMLSDSYINQIGDVYTLNWADGIAEAGNYKIKVVASDALGDKAEKEFLFKVVGTSEVTKSVILSDVMAHGNSYNGANWEADYSWQANDDSLIAYFAYDLKNVADNGIKSVIWSCPNNVYNGKVKFYAILNSWNSMSVDNGIMPELSPEPFLISNGVSAVDMTAYANKLLEKGITTLEFAIRTESADTLVIDKTDKARPYLDIVVSDNVRPVIYTDASDGDYISANAENVINVTVAEDGLINNLTATYNDTDCITDGANGEYTITIPETSQGLYKLTIIAEDNFGVKTVKDIVLKSGDMPVSNHKISVNGGVANAIADVASSNPVLVLVAYKNNIMTGIAIDSIPENGRLMATLTIESADGLTYRSFICDNSNGFMPIKEYVVYP